MENANEITQLELGLNYYFDYNKNCYIKCHEKCKTCSKEYDNNNMFCDECYDNYFLRDNNCLEISNCDYNYYYDNNFNLKCVNRDMYCPDFKPYENAFTKECIENCSILDININCNPTNNLISITDTYKKLLNNLEYLNIKENLLKNKIKHTIFGNNVTFIFSTSEIEKEELFINSNHSSVIFGENEEALKKLYSIPEELPIPILKIEILNNYSNNFELNYHLFNPLNFSQKLDLNLLTQNYIDIRMPITLKQYKMDLIIKTKNLGYNIFDLNNSFYKDICSVFTYNDSDISLSERKNLLDLSEEILCLNNCNYYNYDIIALRSICLCEIGNDTEQTDIKKDDNSEDKYFFYLIKTNIDNLKSSNIKVVKCFSKIFKINLFKENYGFYIILFLLVFNLIVLFFSPITKTEKLFNEYCNDVLNKMKNIYNNNDKEEIKNDLIIESDKNNKNKITEEPRGNNINKRIILNTQINNKPSIALYRGDGKNFPFNTSKNKIRSKFRINYMNPPTSNLILTNNSQIEKTNLSLNKGKQNYQNININKDKENEQKIIEKLKEKNNSDYYIYYIIKYILMKKERYIYLNMK